MRFLVLGLNGAGKTTTIRLLLGMIRPSAGTIRIFGQPLRRGGVGPWEKIGHLVENPAAYPDLTVRENLEVSQRLRGIKSSGPIEAILHSMKIMAYANNKAGTLSTGNLQRLGLARALVHWPDLLILDEPTGGLDPAGLVEIRELLASLARDHGVTIFISSHILSEISRLATRIGIIHHGRLLEDLAAGALDGYRADYLEVGTRNNQAAMQVLEGAGYRVELGEATGHLLLHEARAVEAADEIANLLVRNGCPPTHLAVSKRDLEAHFLNLTAGSQ